MEALGFVQYVEQEFDNECKAKVFELAVPCHTNVAVCSIRQKNYADGVAFARNVRILRMFICFNTCFI